MIKRLMLLLIRFLSKKRFHPFFRRDAVFIRPVQRMPLPLLSDLVRCEAVIICAAAHLEMSPFHPGGYDPVPENGERTDNTDLTRKCPAGQ